jgi:hypothetical protein
VLDLRTQHRWSVVAGIVAVHGCEGCILVVAGGGGVVDIDIVLEKGCVSDGRLVVNRMVC